MPKKLVTDPAEFAAHAHAVANAFGIALLEIAEMAPRPEDAQVTTVMSEEQELGSFVCVAPIKDAALYAVAMHEMGHKIGANGSLHREKARAKTPEAKLALMVVEEEAAWEWAEYYAIDWTTAMVAVKEWALETYRSRQRELAATKAAQQEFLKRRWGW